MVEGFYKTTALRIQEAAGGGEGEGIRRDWSSRWLEMEFFDAWPEPGLISVCHLY